MVKRYMIRAAMEQQQSGRGADDVTGIEPNKLMAAISYVGVLVIIPLLIRRDDSFVVFHAKQGLVILVGYVLASLIVGWVPIVGNLLWLLMIVASIAGFVQAIQGKWWKVPGIGAIADQFRI
jgi:fumarate reductase subunit D